MTDIFSLRDDSPVSETPVSIEEFLGNSNATAVRIEVGEDARQLLPYLDRIALIQVSFPAFTDGRGYSAARILREAGYDGELRAQGDVLLDQIRYMHRCGFDSFAPEKPLNAEQVDIVLKRFDAVYQAAADQKNGGHQNPVWNLRHGN